MVVVVVCGAISEEVRHASRNADSACPFLYWLDGKKGTLSQHFVTHVVPPLVHRQQLLI